MSWLKVSEKFYSFQGEGVTMGVPAVFLRLTACNLLCKSEDWVCDTLEVWKRGDKYLFPNVLTEEQMTRLAEGAHLVVTGGEPLLQQHRLASYLNYLESRLGRKVFVEVETNGTIVPTQALAYLVSQWNCSPKLSNSGESLKRRLNELAITEINRLKNSWFKFVVNKQSDFQEIAQDFGGLIDFNKIILMPAGETQEELNQCREEVIGLARDLGFRYSDRLHIVAWNKKTGV